MGDYVPIQPSTITTPLPKLIVSKKNHKKFLKKNEKTSPKMKTPRNEVYK